MYVAIPNTTSLGKEPGACAGVPWAAAARPLRAFPRPLVSHFAFIGLCIFVPWKPRADVSAGWEALKRPVCDCWGFSRQQDGVDQQESANFLRWSRWCALFSGSGRNGLSCLKRNPWMGLLCFIGFTRLPLSTGPYKCVFPPKRAACRWTCSLHPPGKTTKHRLTWDVRLDSFLGSPGEEATSGGMF